MTHDQCYNRLHLQLDDVPNLLAINKMKPYHQPEGLQTDQLANTCRDAWDARTADNRMTLP